MKIFREPLLHFLLLGGGIFVAHHLISARSADEPGKIIVSQGEIASMAVGFSRTWQRSPTREELEGLIRDRVREEVYCREAIAMGLANDDMIIRRRLRQKLEFVTDDVAALAEPTDAELSEYLRTHSDAFRSDSRFTFSQVYLDPEKHTGTLVQDAAQLLAQLKAQGDNADVSALGDSFLLANSFAEAAATEVAKQFGEKFAASLSKLAPGQWHGPVESGYGVHLIFLAQRTEGRVPELGEIQDSVKREWANARRLESNEKFYQSLLRRYVVVVEPLPPAPDKKLAALK
jgi:hypothetical protein